MKALLFLLSLCFLSLFFIPFQSFAAGKISEKHQIIRISDTAILPNNLTIPKGTQLLIQNTGSRPHWPTLRLDLFHELTTVQAIPAGTQWVVQPEVSGTWQLTDKDASGLHGTVIVTSTQSTNLSKTNPKIPTGASPFDPFLSRVSSWYTWIITHILRL